MLHFLGDSCQDSPFPEPIKNVLSQCNESSKGGKKEEEKERGNHNIKMQSETRHKGNDLPLYSEGGLLSIPQCNGAPSNLVVFVPERIDMEAGMVYGYLPEYGGRKHTSAALSHQKLARSRKGIKTLLCKIRRTYNPIAAQIREV